MLGQNWSFSSVRGSPKVLSTELTGWPEEALQISLERERGCACALG